MKTRDPEEAGSGGAALLAKEESSISPASRKQRRKDRAEIRRRRGERELSSAGENALNEFPSMEIAGSERRSPDQNPSDQTGPKRAGRRKRGQLKAAHPTGKVEADFTASPESEEQKRSGGEGDENQENDGSIEGALAEGSSAASVSRSGGRTRILSNRATISLSADHRHQAAQLYNTLRNAFKSRGTELSLVDPDTDADVAIHVVEADKISSLHTGRCATAIVVRGAEAVAGQRSLLSEAKSRCATILSVETLARRYGESRILSEAGDLGQRGAMLASAILCDRILNAQTNSVPPSISHIGEADDFVEAFQLSHDPKAILKSLDWPAEAPPRSLRTPLDQGVIEHFLQGNIQLTVDGEKQSVPYFIPSDWTKQLESRTDQYTLHGLDFVASVLNYWYLRANGITLPKLAPLGNILKQRGVTASTLLTAAGAVILDSLQNSEKLSDAAWEIPYVQGRARACELFLLCCRMAVLKRIKFDEATCGSVFRALIELLERLRIASFTNLGSAQSVTDASTLIALSLPLRKTRFGALLLEETLEALNAYQLEAGMSRDGVWHDGFIQQCSVLATLRLLAADLRAAEVSTLPVTAAIAKLESFAAAFISFEGMSPPIAESPSVAMKKPAAAPARAQSSLPGGPLREAAVFPDGGFFISRPDKKGSQPSSHLVLQARAAAMGGPSLSFSVGPNSLLIGGGTLTRRAPSAARTAARQSPAAHNAVRVNRQCYAQAANSMEHAIRIENAWEGEDWVAARLINQAFTQARIVRTVIHLKPACGLLVLDQLASASGEGDFEIFWHLAHGLQNTANLSFKCPKGGVLNAAFSGGAHIQMHQGGDDGIGWASLDKRTAAPNPYLACAIRAENTVFASFFRWSIKPLEAHVQAHWAAADEWNATVTLDDRPRHFSYRDGQLHLAA